MLKLLRNYTKEVVKYLIPLLLMINIYAGSCKLIVDDISYFKNELGNIFITKSNYETIWISLKSPVNFWHVNSDDMYVLINNTTVNYLRFNSLNGGIYDGDSVKVSHISWAFPQVGIQGKYLIKSYLSERKPHFSKTINTVGDSLTWGGYGRYLRCLMRDNGLNYDFSGSHTDTFGYRHDGEGGNTTTQVLNRINKIAPSDYYLLLIGTNDWMENLTPEESVNNIKKISSLLNAKNDGVVYISTLLPRLDKFNQRNQEINKLLLSSAVWCDKCILLDIGNSFSELPNYKAYLTDKVHPNLEGYKELSKIIVTLLSHKSHHML